MKMVFKAALNGVFPDYWKKSNTVHVYKKKLRNTLINYRPISLLPIFVVNVWAFYWQQTFQSLPEIQKSPDKSPPIDIRGVFLDISKALDKVWHKGLVYKFKS